EAAHNRMVSAIEKATGRLFSDEERRRIARGADEIDLVNSGLEETMIDAYQQIRELARRDSRITDLRTAAFLSALNKVATSYLGLGIFPWRAAPSGRRARRASRGGEESCTLAPRSHVEEPEDEVDRRVALRFAGAPRRRRAARRHARGWPGGRAG